MKLLEDRIRKDGILAEGNVLKVDCLIKKANLSILSVVC